MTPAHAWTKDAWERQFETVVPYSVFQDDDYRWKVRANCSRHGQSAAYIAVCGCGELGAADARLVCEALNYYERAK